MVVVKHISYSLTPSMNDYFKDERTDTTRPSSRHPLAQLSRFRGCTTALMRQTEDRRPFETGTTSWGYRM
eukprot:6174475-Pleurochrysis_carterae.AAC.1